MYVTVKSFRPTMKGCIYIPKAGKGDGEDAFARPFHVIEMMSWPWFLRILTVLCFVALFFSHGFGRNLMERGDQHEESSFQTEEVDRNIRKMYEVMDYADPEPNVNPRTGYPFTPPPQPN